MCFEDLNDRMFILMIQIAALNLLKMYLIPSHKWESMILVSQASFEPASILMIV